MKEVHPKTVHGIVTDVQELFFSTRHGLQYAGMTRELLSSTPA